MGALKSVRWNVPNTSLVSSQGIESVSGDVMQNLEWILARAALDFVTRGIKSFIVRAVAFYSIDCRFVMWFELLSEEVVRRFGEEEKVFKIDRETILRAAWQPIGFLPNHDISHNPTPTCHFD